MRVAILLAAGRSRRFAGGNKLLAKTSGRTLVAHAVVTARAAPVGRVIVVVGHDRDRIIRQVRRPGVSIVLARDYRDGVAASLRAGVAALRPRESEIFVFLGDMPNVSPLLAGRLARRLKPGDAAVRPRSAAGPGHPVLLRRPSRAILSRLSGDRGLGALIAGETRWVQIAERRSPDIDTRRDWARHR